LPTNGFPKPLLLILPLSLPPSFLSSFHSIQRLRQFQDNQAKQARTQQLKQTAAFRQHDDGSGASVLMLCSQGASLWAVANDAYAARLQGATELWDKALQRQLIWAYLMAPIYAPEDRQQFFDLVAEMIFGHLPVKMTMLCRIYENDGTSHLCLESLQSVILAPGMPGLLFKTESK
jgi:hypothetical protein